MYNRVKQRFASARRDASTSATPIKAEIIRIKKTGETPYQDSPLWTYKETNGCDPRATSQGVTRLSSCDVMHRRHSDVCDVLRGCSDATASCICNPEQANMPRCYRSRCEAVCSVGPYSHGFATRPNALAHIDAHLEDFRPRPRGLPGTP